MSLTQYRIDEQDPDDGGGGLDEEWRFDVAPMAAMKTTPEGYLLAEGQFAKPGVLLYRRSDGTVRRELVLPEELHDPESLASMARKPVTNNHPGRKDRPVGPHNVKRLAVGDVDGELVVVEDGHVRVKVAVRDSKAIREVRAGKRALSPGYRVRIEKTSGEHPEYGAFDVIQRDRRYDHLAIVKRGRGGPSVHLRADEADQVVDDHDDSSTSPWENIVNPLLFLASLVGLSIRSDATDEAKTQALADGIKDLKTRADEADALKTQIEAEKARADKAEEDLGKVQTDLESARADAVDHDGLLAWHKARVVLEQRAEQYKVDGADEMGNDDLRRAVVAAAVKDLPEDASDDYVRARFDLLGEQRSDGSEPWANVRGPRQPGDGKKAEKDRRRDDSPADGLKGYADTFEAARPHGRA